MTGNEGYQKQPLFTPMSPALIVGKTLRSICCCGHVHVWSHGSDGTASARFSTLPVYFAEHTYLKYKRFLTGILFVTVS
jgi:hypothetical protein